MTTIITTTQKKPCFKCDKGGGVFTCDGCQQSFCRKHSDEHRQELAVQMDTIGQECDALQRDINKNTDINSFLSHIDEWEQESIDRIQQAAHQARVDLNELFKKSREKMTTIVAQLTNELQFSRTSENYTELDFKKWTVQLNELRHDLEQSISTCPFDNNDQNSIIHLIKVKIPRELCPWTEPIRTFNQNPILINHEKFNKKDQQIALSENDLTATYFGDDLHRSVNVFGFHQYLNGTHHIRFQIKKKANETFFIGIVTYSQMDPSSVFFTTAINGWWLDSYWISNGRSRGKQCMSDILEGDEIILTLDCNQRRIYLAHPRTKTLLQIRIDDKKCPLPWKIVVGLGGIGNCIRIIN
ncbi:unnamed protein product [Adineta steineri]|uniref:B box-type domain-containing protein n=1 Tax=Adineta steineri TaxID=433720 RepID=A0A818NQC5_9BILA|nr:unnamed protein product [Adineta steineri]CAF3608499.1 unnamed protein product [Adineta steineri]